MTDPYALASRGDVTVEMAGEHVAVVEIHRPPNNHFDVGLIRDLADTYEALDGHCRAIVLCSEGKHFCAGADFTNPSAPSLDAAPGTPFRASASQLYDEAARLFEARTPVVAAVQGAAIGGGLGLACSADFRVTCPEARFSANFARLGFHQGFGLTVTLPSLVGQQGALDLLLTGRRVDGEEALRMGLCDSLVEGGDLRRTAIDLAGELAASAPLAVRSIRATMRDGLVERFREATLHEQQEQDELRKTEDFVEGVRATAERRDALFTGR
jgi:enoyl-CoA hydratase/carnithine racemase